MHVELIYLNKLCHILFFTHTCKQSSNNHQKLINNIFILVLKYWGFIYCPCFLETLRSTTALHFFQTFSAEVYHVFMLSTDYWTYFHLCAPKQTWKMHIGTRDFVFTSYSFQLSWYLNYSLPTLKCYKGLLSHVIKIDMLSQICMGLYM